MLLTPFIPLENILAIEAAVQIGALDTVHDELHGVPVICWAIEASVAVVFGTHAALVT